MNKPPIPLLLSIPNGIAFAFGDLILSTNFHPSSILFYPIICCRYRSSSYLSHASPIHSLFTSVVSWVSELSFKFVSRAVVVVLYGLVTPGFGFFFRSRAFSCFSFRLLYPIFAANPLHTPTRNRWSPSLYVSRILLFIAIY